MDGAIRHILIYQVYDMAVSGLARYKCNARASVRTLQGHLGYRYILARGHSGAMSFFECFQDNAAS